MSICKLLKSGALATVFVLVSNAAMAQGLYDWTGMYVGGHIGGGRTATNIDTSATDFIAIQNKSYDVDDYGVIGGVQVGYDWQFNKSWLIGIEADWSWTDLDANGYGVPTTLAGAPISQATEMVTTEVDWLATIRGRLGWTTNRTLVYLTGGAAWGKIKFSGNNNFPATPASYPFSNDSTRTGWVLGGGLEYAMSDNLIFGAEYLHYDLDGETVTAERKPIPNPLQEWTYSADNTKIDSVNIKAKYKF